MNATLIEYTETEHEEFLNELYPDGVDICGINYGTGTALKRVDPIAFECDMADMDEHWECSECSSVHDNIEDAEECCNDLIE